MQVAITLTEPNLHDEEEALDAPSPTQTRDAAHSLSVRGSLEATRSRSPSLSNPLGSMSIVGGSTVDAAGNVLVAAAATGGEASHTPTLMDVDTPPATLVSSTAGPKSSKPFS